MISVNRFAHGKLCFGISNLKPLCKPIGFEISNVTGICTPFARHLHGQVHLITSVERVYKWVKQRACAAAASARADLPGFGMFTWTKEQTTSRGTSQAPMSWHTTRDSRLLLLACGLQARRGILQHVALKLNETFRPICWLGDDGIKICKCATN